MRHISANHITEKMPDRKKELLSTAMKRTNEWILSLEIPSDVTVNVAGNSFPLHKFPLVSKCGYIKKLVAESSNSDVSVINISDAPGGAEAFELAAKFCYGINFMITAENVAMLRCVAEYLEMTEDYADGNLIRKIEVCIKEIVLNSLTGSVSILHCCESLLPMAEKVKLVSRCIDTIAFIACKDSQFDAPVKADNGINDFVPSTLPTVKPVVFWWAEHLTILRIDLFQRVVVAMMARGFKQHTLGPVLVLYAEKFLGGLEIFGKGRKKNDPREKHEKGVILETILSLLPRDKNTISIKFLSRLLKAAIYLETTISCRLDVEMRIALQLEQAMVDDLLIPSNTFAGDTLFDVETVKRIVVTFFKCNSDIEINKVSCKMERVTRLLETYYTEVSSDPNLSVSMFVSLAELIPDRFRVSEDGIYRAIDIYLKTHPALSNTERKIVCSVIDFRKLSHEANDHAAKNDRLPVQTIVQVLSQEQHHLREVVDESLALSPALLTKRNEYSYDVHPAMTDEVSSLRKENLDLKLELVKMRTRLKEMKGSPLKPFGADCPVAITPKTVVDKSPLPWKSFISSISRKFSKLVWTDGRKINGKTDAPRKVRRHSIS